jgi:hypothetical protein
LQTKIQVLQRPKALVQPRKVYKRNLGKHTELLDHKDSLRKMEQELQSFTDPVRSTKLRKRSASYPANLPRVDICAIGAVGFHRNVTKPGATVFVTSLYKID